MTLRTLLALPVALLLCRSAVIEAQRPDSSAVLEGTVVSDDGAPLTEVTLRVAGGRDVNTDAAGHYRLDHLAVGSVAVVVRRIGFARRDTLVILKPGRTTQLNVRLERYVLGLSPVAFERESHVADSTNLANGKTDSAAAGLLPRRGADDPPYERFGARLLSTIAHQRGADSNTVVSPLSAGLALALVANGARDATFHALAGTLGAASFDADALAARDSVLLSSLSARHDVTLEVANALWMSPKYHAQPTYLDKAGRAYLSSVRTIALDSASGIAVINAWVNDKTHGRIATILDAPLSDTTALVITNAVYFHGLWLSAFDRAITRPLAYHRRPGVTDSVPAMERTTNLLYLKGAGMQAVRLPYRGGRAALFVLLPDSGVSVDELESRLARDGWPHQLSAYHSHDVHLRLPRVHAEATVDLKGPLKALGSAIAFDCARADFRALLILGAEQNACIDKATQKTYLDIDEEGTEAAAVTATTTLVSTGVVVPPPPIEFIVDRPFLFVLRDEVSGAPLFMGRIVLPGVKR